MQEKFNEVEDTTGIRMSWHAWPTNRIDAVSCSVPIGVLYTPLKQIPNRDPLPYRPVYCRCRAVLNSFCQVDYTSHVWTCPICGHALRLALTPDGPRMSREDAAALVEQGERMRAELTGRFPAAASPVRGRPDG